MLNQPIIDVGSYLEDIGIYINRVEEQATPHPHSHEFIEITYVAKGKGIHILNGEEYQVSKGDLFVINYDCVHEFRSQGSKLVVYNCVILPQFIDESLSQCRNFKEVTNNYLFASFFADEENKPSDIRLAGKDCSILERIYESMLIEYNSRPLGFEQMLKAQAVELLITVFRLWFSSKNMSRKLLDARNILIEKAIGYIKENYKSENKLTDLAGMLFISPAHFSRLFKKTCSMTVTEYIQKIRIENACKLLNTTNKTVFEVAEDVGYTDIKHFNAVFKKNTGKTPSKYRKS